MIASNTFDFDAMEMAPHHKFMRRLFWHLGYLWLWMPVWWFFFVAVGMSKGQSQALAAVLVVFCYAIHGLISYLVFRKGPERGYWILYGERREELGHISDWQEQEDR